MSAPCSSGRHRYGVATVLSATSGTPTSWATPATPAMSKMSFFGIADGLAEEGLGVVAGGGAPGVEVVGILDEADLDAQLGQGVVEEVVGAAVERGAGHDVIAGLGQGQHGHRLGGLARCHRERTGDTDGRLGATLEVGHPRLEHALRGVHDPRVRCCPSLPGRTARRRVTNRGTGTRWSGRWAPPAPRWWDPAPGRHGSCVSRSPAQSCAQRRRDPPAPTQRTRELRRHTRSHEFTSSTAGRMGGHGGGAAATGGPP